MTGYEWHRELWLAGAEEPPAVLPIGGEWTVEGVAQCPGRCGLFFDVEGTLPELEKFIKAHDCAQARKDTRYTP